MTTKRSTPRVPSDLLGERIREVRQRQNLTAEQVAEMCAERGAPEITAQAIFNIETGRRGKDGRRRRHITVDEWLILAEVLQVAPVHLLVPTRELRYPFVPVEPVSEENGRYSTAIASRVREWVRGEEPMPGTDPRIWFSEMPPDEITARLSR